MTIIGIREGESNRMSHLLSQTALEVLEQHVAEQSLDVGLEHDRIIATVPSVNASIESVLELRRCISVGLGERGLTGSR